MIGKDLGFYLPKRNEIFNDENRQRTNKIKNFGIEIIQSFEEITNKKYDYNKKTNTIVKNFNF